MTVRRILLFAAAVALLAGWYAFRPERAFFDHRVNEPLPEAPVSVRLAGEFAPRAHRGRGRAEILELREGRRVLRLSAFATSNGPDLQVYLLGAAGATTRAELSASGYLSLGPLKGNVGDQNYPIPASVDLVAYRAVAIWCRRFGVNFTTAPLEPTASPAL